MSLLSVVHYCENCLYNQRNTLLVFLLSVVHYCQKCLYNQSNTLLVFLLSVVHYCENRFIQLKEDLTGVYVIGSLLL